MFLVLAGMAQNGRAASATWTGTSATDVWTDMGSWNPSVPGATSGTTNTDTANFLSSGNSTITVDTYRNIDNLSFAGTSAYTLTGGNFYLTSGGSIADTSSVNQAINSNVYLEGSYTFSNSATSTSATLNFGSTVNGGTIEVDPATAAGTSVLTLEGTNTSTNVIDDAIANGGSSGTLGVTIGSTTAGTSAATNTWNLAGTNTYSGTTSIVDGTLITSGTNTSSGAISLGGTSSTTTLELNNTNNGGIASGTLTIQSLSQAVQYLNVNVTTSLSNAIAMNHGYTIEGTGNLTFNGLYTIGGNSITLDGTTGQQYNFAGGVSLGGNELNIHGGTYNFESPITGTAILNNGGGGSTIIMDGNSTFSGGFYAAATNAIIDFEAQGTSSSNSGIGTGTLTIGGVSTGNSETIDAPTGAINFGLTTNNAINLQGYFIFTGTNNLNFGTGAVSLGSLAQATEKITTNADTLTFGGVISNGTNGTTPTDAINKLGAGTLALGGANTYSGGTTISAGTLFLTNTSGSGTGSGAVSLMAATLGGTGSASGLVTASGATHTSIIAPAASLSSSGNPTSVGTLTLSGGVADSGSSGLTLKFAIDGAGATNSQLSLSSGNLTVGGTLVVDLYDLGTNTLASNTPYTIVLGSGTPTVTSYSAVLIGSTAYTLNPSYGNGGIEFTGTGDNLSFEVTAAVPEPSTLSLALLALGLGFLNFLWSQRPARV